MILYNVMARNLPNDHSFFHFKGYNIHSTHTVAQTYAEYYSSSNWEICLNFAHLTFVLSSSLLVRFSVPKTKQKSKIGEKRTESIEKKEEKSIQITFRKECLFNWHTSINVLPSHLSLLIEQMMERMYERNIHVYLIYHYLPQYGLHVQHLTHSNYRKTETAALFLKGILRGFLFFKIYLAIKFQWWW